MRQRILKHLELVLILVVLVGILGYFLSQRVISFFTAYRGNAVWCVTVLTGGDGSTITFGHYPGMELEEVIEQYGAPIEFLHSAKEEVDY